MLLALVGSHGTGKTTVFNEIKRMYPQHQFFSEAARQQVASFGYDNPYEVVEELGIAAFELMNINAWSVIDQKINTLLDLNKQIITDRSAVDNYAYYLSLRQTEADFASLGLVKAMASYYAALVDIFVYFPISDSIPLVKDDMRKDSVVYQRTIDTNILASFSELGVPQTKIYKLRSLELNSRVKEVVNLFK